MSDNNPAAIIKIDPLIATVSRNGGQNGPVYTVQFAKVCRSGKNTWRNSDRFDSSDLFKLPELADLARLEIRDLLAKDRRVTLLDERAA
jgi:hypothetical protein